MPALDYATTALVARDLFEPTDSSSINTKSILIIIFVALVPVLIVSGVVSWLLCCYSRGQSRANRRDKGIKNKSLPATPQTDREIAAFLRPAPDQNPGRSRYAQSTPTRPAEAHIRNDSMMSRGSDKSGRSMNEKAPAVPKGFI